MKRLSYYVHIECVTENVATKFAVFRCCAKMGESFQQLTDGSAIGRPKLKWTNFVNAQLYGGTL